MQIKFLFILIIISTLFFTISCKKETTLLDAGNNDSIPALQIAKPADITLIFENEVDGTPLELGELNYTNDAGNIYSVNLLKYYVSNIILIDENGIEAAYPQFELINGDDAAFSQIALNQVPPANYTTIKFSFGIDEFNNHDGDQEGDLDPSNGMIWSWSTGYIFYKHEGKFIDNTGNEQSILLHFGTDDAFINTIEVAIILSVDSIPQKLVLNFNLNSVYASPNIIDFNADNNHQSTLPSDKIWIEATIENLFNAFTFDRAE